MSLTALAPVAARLLRQFGEGARFRMSTPQRQADGSSVPQWNDVAEMTAAPIVLEDLGSERALRRWGAETLVHVEATVAVPVSVTLEPIGLGLVLSTGPRAGTRYLVAGLTFDDTTRVATLALQHTRDALGLP